MAIQKITIADFIAMVKSNPVLDVRSPGEFSHAHIPSAFNLPLFSDEERKIVGTAYKQQNKEAAIKFGLDFFGVKMKKMVEETEDIVSRFLLSNKKLYKHVGTQQQTGKQETRNILVHCWRGGMRSAGVAWLLDLYGFKVYTLIGGYKAYRKWVRDQFEKHYCFTILGGYTGSGKTLVLQELHRLQHCVVNLEALACHKGSAFGAMGEKTQPTQEMFENLLAEALIVDCLPLVEAANLHNNPSSTINLPIWLEDESQRIGNLQIPMPLWATIRKSPVIFLDIPFEERLNYLTLEYGVFEKEKLVNAIIRIQKRLGGLETKNAINFLLENNHKECFRILLTYYDKWYEKGLQNRENLPALLNKITCAAVDVAANIQLTLKVSKGIAFLQL